MQCPSCSKDVTDVSFFCKWCNRFLPAPELGEKAGLFHRALAVALDLVVPLLTVVVAGSITGVLGVVVFVAWVVLALRLFGRGETPGKRLLGLRVVKQRTGALPGVGGMLVREWPGRIVAGLVFGLGWLWAIIDRDGQGWHDKIGGTVVLKVKA